MLTNNAETHIYLLTYVLYYRAFNPLICWITYACGTYNRVYENSYFSVWQVYRPQLFASRIHICARTLDTRKDELKVAGIHTAQSFFLLITRMLVRLSICGRIQRPCFSRPTAHCMCIEAIIKMLQYNAKKFLSIDPNVLFFFCFFLDFFNNRSDRFHLFQPFFYIPESIFRCVIKNKNKSRWKD